MTRETEQHKAEVACGRQPELEAFTKDFFAARKEELIKNVSVRPAIRFQEFNEQFTQVFGHENVSMGEQARKIHGKDLTAHHLAVPDVVIYPKSIDQVQWLTKFATSQPRNPIPLIPFGLGSSLEGNIAAIHGGICVDLSRMCKVLEFHPEDREIRIQPGITRNALNDYLKDSGLFFPIDCGSDATIGGMIGTNASGPSALYYGTMKDQVMAMKVVMADGSIVTTGRRAQKSSAGYDLNKLIVGSEGTLGIIVEVTLKLQTVPKAIGSAIVSFGDSAENSIKSVSEIIKQGLPLMRCEFLDPQSIRAINQFHQTAFDEEFTLFIESHGLSRAVVDVVLDECKDICRERGMTKFVQFSDEEVQEMLWKARHTAWLAIPKLIPGSEALVTDVAVPMSRLTEAILFAQKEAEQAGITAPIIGHVGDGNFHVFALVKPNDPNSMRIGKNYCENIVKKALEMEGTCTAEHGIGVGKREFLEAELGKEAVKVMRSIKRALDPQNIMNPGKILFSFE